MWRGRGHQPKGGLFSQSSMFLKQVLEPVLDGEGEGVQLKFIREEFVYHGRSGEGKLTNWSPLPDSTDRAWVTFFFFAGAEGRRV